MSFHVVGMNNEENYEISKEKFDCLLLLKKNYSSVLKMEEMYCNVVKNFKELEMTIFEMSLDSIIYWDYSWNTFKDRIHETDRRLINLLTHTRLFLDGSDKILEEVYGHESKECKYFSKLKSVRYDSNFSYRLMEALRNYVIHGDLPIGELNFRHKYVEVNGESKKVSDCSPKLNLKLIREDKKFKMSMLKEMEELTEVDMRYHIRSFISDLSSIHRMFNDHQSNSVSNLIMELIELKQLFKNPDKVKGVRIIDSVSSDGCAFTFVMLDRFNDLIEVNSTYHQIHEMMIMM